MEAAVAQLRQNHLHEEAAFLAERLLAEQPCDRLRALLAECYLGAGSPRRAKGALQGATSPRCRFLLARALLALGETADVERALLEHTGLLGASLAAREAEVLADPCPVPEGAAGLFVLGQAARQAGRAEQAVACFRLALQLDPYQWGAFVGLCELGEELDPRDAFGVYPTFYVPPPAPAPAAAAAAAPTPGAAGAEATPLAALHTPAAGPGPSPFLTPLPPAEERMSTPFTPAPSSVAARLFATPGSSAAMPPRPPRALKRLFDSGAGPGSAAAAAPAPAPPRRTPVSLPLPLPPTPAAGAPTPAQQPPTAVATEDEAALRLLCALGCAFFCQAQFRCGEALELLHRLSPAQFASGWVQEQVGRAYFELAQYDKSASAFGAMRRAEAHRVSGLDVYSTALWHLKRSVDLCLLAQQAAELDRLAPQTWCVLGNCFSLQKEHDVALQYFRRAAQVDAGFAYAFTLCAHEHVATEAFDKAVACYRTALRLDERHYKGWYGLGCIYYRQEKFQMAEYHFRRALQIHPGSSVLCCYLGMTMHAHGRHYEALDMLARASEIEPDNPQARFQRASVLLALERPEDALVELEAVRARAPTEASVHVLLGRVCKQLGRLPDALTHFSTALSLDPKDANNAKQALDRLEQSEDEEDEEDPF